MKPGCRFPESRLARLRELACSSACLAALYTLPREPGDECNLIALFADDSAWSERLDLELAMAEALGVEGLELTDLRRMPLVSRYAVVARADLLYVGRPELLAPFIEQTTARYQAFYPLLEALYWKAEATPQPGDMDETQ
jgi:hypothetical protein